MGGVRQLSSFLTMAGVLTALAGVLPSAGGGPNVWYDAIAQADTDAANSANDTIMLWSKVSALSGGTATKLRIYVTNNTGASDVKMALYTSGGVLMDSGLVNVGASNQYFEVTLDDGDAVAATDYYIAFQPDSSTAGDWRYKAGFTSGDTKFSLNAYASFPPANLPVGTDLDWHMAIGVYVD
jgi:hypothetical protein